MMAGDLRSIRICSTSRSRRVRSQEERRGAWEEGEEGGTSHRECEKRLGVIGNTNQRRCERMQHPVCSQRRSSPPSIHPAIKTLNSINLSPSSPVGFCIKGSRPLQHPAPSTQHPAPRW